MIIGIDHGFGAIKTRSTTFRTGLSESKAEPAIQGANDILYLNDTDTYYATSGTRQSVRYDKTSDENYWILTLIAIAKEVIARKVDDRKLSITIAAGLPLGTFATQKDAFRTYLERTGTRHQFVFNGEQFDVEIEGVKLFPQGYSAIINELGTLKNEPVVHIVDIGSWTTDIVTLKNGIPDVDSQTSWENGVIRCISEITENVKIGAGITYPPETIEAVLWNKQISIAERGRTKIRHEARKWSADFMRKLAEKGIDVESTVTRFLGGGAHIITEFYRDEHMEEMELAQFLEGVAANAIGYEQAARMLAANAAKA